MTPQNTTEAFEALKEYMVREYNAKIASGGKEIVKRCHFCGDSRDPSERHLYIGLNKGAIKYNCFKCNTSGVVDAKFLRDLECYDTGLINLCIEQNKQFINSNSIKKGTINSIYKLKNIVLPLSNNEFAIKKLNYISNRLGMELTTNDVTNFKIILNLKDFLDFNNLKYTRHPDLIDLLDKYFIGFLSSDNKYVILRRLIPEGKLPKEIDSRYLNYNILGRQDGNKFYTIPGFVDISKPFEIHIAEGAFDIISIYNYVAPIGTNGIFAAIGGKSYLNLVKYFIINYGFMKFDLHLYPDSDVGLRDMQVIKNETKIFNINCFIHKNMSEGQKDYGVSPDKIIDSIIKI